jgi:hypothetical protein
VESVSQILKRVAVFVGFQEDEAASVVTRSGWSDSGPGLVGWHSRAAQLQGKDAIDVKEAK